jgi:glutathione S-transferase
MKLYGAILSPFVRKTAVVLNVKGLSYEHEPSFPGSLPRTLSPLGKIPAFTDGDLSISDSSVICEYLEEKYPQVPVMPKALNDRARARWLEEFADTKMTELAGGIFFERILKPMMKLGATDEAKVNDVITNLMPPQLDYLEGQVPTDGWLFGSFGTADIALVSSFYNAGYAGFKVDAARWPKLAAFIGRVAAHPAVKKQLDAEAALMKQMASANK